MAKAISVKVATPKVIAALETKLETIKTTKENEKQLEAAFQEELKAWNKALFDYALSKFYSATNIRTNYRSWSNSLNIDFDVDTQGKDFPAQPTRQFEQLHDHNYREIVDEIENAIRILKMTDEETVNASTFKSIAQYL